MPTQKITNPFGKDWRVAEKRGAGANYDKYDTLCVVIVARVNEAEKDRRNGREPRSPAQIYLSKRAYESIGKPPYIEVRVNDESGMIAFIPVTKEEYDAGLSMNAYAANFSSEDVKHEGRPTFSMRAVIRDNKLQSGVYTAQIFQEGINVALIIFSGDKPSLP